MRLVGSPSNPFNCDVADFQSQITVKEILQEHGRPILIWTIVRI